MPFGVLLALLAGGLQACALATPWDGQPSWALQLLALGVLAWLLSAGHWRSRQAFALGWVFACAWLVGTFWWLFISMHTYGGLAAPLAMLAVLGLAGFLALYYALAGWVFVAFSALAQAGRALNAMVFAGLWLLAELARGVWFTGFPWGAVGYAHVDGPLAAYAPWVGVYGMNFLAAVLAMAGAQWVRAMPSVLRAMVPLLMVLVLLGLLPWGLQAINRSADREAGRSAGSLSLSLLQGNIPQDEKFQPGTGVPIALQWYGQQLIAANTALVVAPETAVPMLPADLPAGYWSALQQRFGDGTQAALIGIPLGSMRLGYTNSVVGLKPGALPAMASTQDLNESYRYDKQHLVPFGEFIPPLFRWFTELMNIPLGDFNRGAADQASFAWQGQRLAPNICYEDLFGEELGARFADPALAPTVFVNVSNIGWFGNGLAIDQHTQISRLRALEFARPMVRATNTGATVVIDHQGQVTAALPRATRGVLRADVEGRHGITPFAWWVSRWGLWPAWLLGVLIVVTGFAVAQARRRSGGGKPGGHQVPRA